MKPVLLKFFQSREETRKHAPFYNLPAASFTAVKATERKRLLWKLAEFVYASILSILAMK